jgi:hypothetical protein
MRTAFRGAPPPPFTALPVWRATSAYWRRIFFHTAVSDWRRFRLPAWTLFYTFPWINDGSVFRYLFLSPLQRGRAVFTAHAIPWFWAWYYRRCGFGGW